MSNINSQATVNLTVNGQQPLQVLQQLKQRAMELENAIAKAPTAESHLLTPKESRRTKNAKAYRNTITTGFALLLP